MTQQINITSFTPQVVAAGGFKDNFPEYYTLQNVIESQSWHDNQSVFDHHIKSGEELEKIISFDYLAPEQKTSLTAYLDAPYDTLTRKQLLRFATLLHDIGKLISLQTNAQGDTGSPSHGLIGEWIASEFTSRFVLTDKEAAFVLSLISDHLVPSDLIELSINNQTDPSQVTDILSTHRPRSAIELLLLSYADWLGCDIRESVRGERDKRVIIVHACLATLSQKGGE